MINRSTVAYVVTCWLAWQCAVALAQPAATQPAADPSAAAGIDRMREALQTAYNAGDVEGILKFIHPDAVIIFPDGEILKGPGALRDYYQRMLTAPDHVVERYTAEPVVESRTVHGDVGLSYGRMNDQYVLTDGTRFGLDSRFTITLFQSPNGPPDTDGWMIRSFHSSTDAFDNPILALAAKRVFWFTGIAAVLIGLVLGFVLGRFARCKQSARTPAAE